LKYSLAECVLDESYNISENFPGIKEGSSPRKQMLTLREHKNGILLSAFWDVTFKKDGKVEIVGV